jgi:hypothetical protein
MSPGSFRQPRGGSWAAANAWPRPERGRPARPRWHGEPLRRSGTCAHRPYDGAGGTPALRPCASKYGADGHLHGAPDLVVEVLSPGAKNVRRDREAKLKTYSKFGVREYWIVNWPRQERQVYRREQAALVLIQTLQAGDQITSPLLPGFTARLSQFFARLTNVADG